MSLSNEFIPLVGISLEKELLLFSLLVSNGGPVFIGLEVEIGSY